MTRQRILITGVIVGSLLSMTGREAQAAEWSAEPSSPSRGVTTAILTLTHRFA